MLAFGRRLGALLAGLALAAPAFADPVLMVPRSWQIGMQAAHSPVEKQLQALNDGVTVVIVVISVFVAGLLGFVLWRYNHRRHPVPGTVSHNSVLEAAWTVLPVLILVGIAIPSFRLVYFEDRTRQPDLTVKVIGHQWYWEYAYPDAGGLHFSSYVIDAKDLKPGQLRNLAVDNQLVLPAGKNIRILTTSDDVIHSFFIPSLGVQRYAIPGRVIETWVKIDEPGDYYGECNQICGMNHSLMPIGVHAVSADDFTAWLNQKRAHGSSAAAVPAARFAAATEH